MSESAAKPSRLRRVLRSRIVWVTGGLLLLYTLCGFLLAPWLVRTQWPALVEKHLGAEGSLSEVRINPFLLTFEAGGIAIAEKGKPPALQVGRLFVDFETGSLLRWAWTFREIRIERPVINAELDASENLNLVRLLAPLIKDDDANTSAENEKVKSSPLPRFLLQQLTIADGTFDFTDHGLRPAAHARVSPLGFEIRDVSTLPDFRGEHRFEAKMSGGGSLQWQGKLSLAPLDTSGTLALKDARLATLWRFVQDQLTIAEPAGSYEMGLQYRLRYAEGALQLHADDIAFRMKDVALAQQKDGSKLANVGSLALEGGSLDLQKRTLAFKDMHVADGAINIILDEDSTPDWATLVRSHHADTKPAEPKNSAAPEPAAAAPWQISLPRIGIDAMALNLVDYSRVKPLRMAVGTSQINLGVATSIGDQVQVTVNDGALKLQDILVTTVNEESPPVTLNSAELTGFALDLQKKTIHAELARFSGGRTWVRRNADGELQLVSMFTPRKVRVLKELQQEGFSIVVDRAEMTGYAVAYTDQSFQPAIQYDLEQLHATVSKITLPPKNASPFEFALQVKQGGAMKAKGAIDILKQSVDVRFEATDLALAPLQPILKHETTLTLASGKASSTGRITVNAKNEPASLQYRGNASIADLDLKIENSADRLVSWNNVQVDNIDLDTGKNRLTVAQVSLARPYTKLVVHKDRSTNLAAVLRPRPAGTPAPEPSAKAPMAISIERVSVERGEMDFADFSLILPFATNVKSLNGSVNGLSSTQDSRASLKFEGRIEDYGLARAEGSLQAFNPKKFMDITAIFRNVEMPPLSPYSATFAGRKIESGRISLDLKYKLNNSLLSGDNKILLERLKLGEKVESPDAVNLPLDLAIALLTDSEGKIDLAVPVTGNVDSPEFSYGHVIWQAVRTVITNIVSAPFRALGSLFGADAKTLGELVFDPGSARVLPTEYEKVRRIVDGLRKRPQLKLVVQGVYHAESDSRALRTQAVRHDLALREGLKLKPGEDPGPIGFDSPKIQRTLEIMLNERAGGDAAAQFATAYQKTAGREAARVNPALALLNQGAGDRELYVAMHQKLIELQPLPPQSLEELGKARTATIVNGFTKRFKFDPARLASKPPVAVDALVNNGVPLKLSFEPMK